METAVYVDIVARSIPQTVAAQQTDRTGYILRCSPSAQWGKVPFSIRLSYLPCTLLVMSVAITPGAYLVDQNSFGCQTVCIQSRQHRDSSLGHAVFTTIGRRYDRTATGYVDDHTLAAIQRFLLNHLFLQSTVSGTYCPWY